MLVLFRTLKFNVQSPVQNVMAPQKWFLTKATLYITTIQACMVNIMLDLDA
tara:strand:- start:1430 stop:1582 length:153 start_codon:yes stop_codon:yes gene_type:complete